MAELMLRETLDRLKGAVITPEVAAAIEYAAFHQVDGSIDPSGFAVMVHHDYRFQAERFADIIDELHPLHAAQWQETEAYRHEIEFHPDYQSAMAQERAGSLVQFTIRCGGELAGHMRLYVQTSMHTGTLFAQEDTIYIKAEHRGGMVGLAFLRYIEAALGSIGVREIRFDTKHTNRADALLRRLRYQPVATRWVKILKE